MKKSDEKLIPTRLALRNQNSIFMSYRACLPTALADTLPLGIFQRYQKEELIEYIAGRLKQPLGMSVKEHRSDSLELVFEVTNLPSCSFLRDLLTGCAEDAYIQHRGDFFSSIAAEKLFQRDKKFIPILEKLKYMEMARDYLVMGALAGAVVGDYVDLARYAADDPCISGQKGSTLLIIAIVNRNRKMIELLLKIGHRIWRNIVTTSVWSSEAMALLDGELLEYRDRVLSQEIG